MKKWFLLLLIIFIGCDTTVSQEKKDSETVDSQQKQYSASQPVPAFNWSLERHLVIQLYQMRNQKALTHSVWRADRGMIEGDCASIGFSIPYDTSITNPLKGLYLYNGAGATIEQAEPNGIFASKNTSATWVMCAGDGGMVEPVYVETKVTVYPYPVAIDYTNNRVSKAGESSVKLRTNK